MEVADEVFAGLCLHNLIAIDVVPVLAEEANESNLLAISTRNATHLFNKLLSLPSEMCDEGRLAIIPSRQTLPIPRERKIPSPKPKTRWDKFAEQQGIHKQKRSRKVWDDVANDWMPRWGGESLKNKRRKAEEAIIEMKPGQELRTVIEDMRAEQKLGKKKQEFREIRNKVEGVGGRLPRGSNTSAGVAALSNDDRKKGKEVLEEMNRRAAVSTASFGVHDKPVNLGNKAKTKKLIQKKSKKKVKTKKCR